MRIHLIRRLQPLLANRRAATAIEYGLIAALIAVASIVAMRGVAGGMQKLWGSVSAAVDSVMN